LNALGKKLAKMAFEDLKADYLLLIREEHGDLAPAFVSKGEDVGDVCFDAPYQLVTILSRIYPHVPKGKIAIVARRCDDLAINELIKRGFIDEKRIIRIGLACDGNTADKCRCPDPKPGKVNIGEPVKGIPEDPLVAKLMRMSLEDRLTYWVRMFRKCNKCFGCTINCPVCFCENQCVLGERTLVAEKSIPPGLAFHLVRSFHMADKCIECGECERACPGDIPLLALRRMVHADMKELYEFAPGDTKAVSPLLTTLEGEMMEDERNVC
jgi:ferredoxin